MSTECGKSSLAIQVTYMEALTISPVFLCSLIPNGILKQFAQEAIYILSVKGTGRVLLKLTELLWMAQNLKLLVSSANIRAPEPERPTTGAFLIRIFFFFNKKTLSTLWLATILWDCMQEDKPSQHSHVINQGRNTLIIRLTFPLQSPLPLWISLIKHLLFLIPMLYLQEEHGMKVLQEAAAKLPDPSYAVPILH